MPPSAREDGNGKLVELAIKTALTAMPAPTPPGLAIAVYFEGKTYFYYQGVRALGGKPIDANSIFELGSVTKSFTGIMLGTDVNQKVADVRLSDHPAPWIVFAGNPNRVAPDPVETTCATPTATPVPPKKYGTVKQMTLEELATHTSGLPDEPPPPNGGIVQRQCYSPQQFVNYIEKGKKFTPPPAPYLYSDIGFGYLGYVLQGVNNKATGRKAKSWYILAREQILDPLGMTHTYNLNVPRDMLAEYIQGYTFKGCKPPFTGCKPKKVLHWTWDAWPAAGVLRSTATDMAKYLELALRLKGPAELIAGAKTAEKAYTKDGAGYGQGLAWAYGLLYQKEAKPPPPQVIWKDGGTAGCSTWIGLLFEPKRDVAGIVVLTNGNKMPVGPLGRGVLTPLYLHELGYR
ncbi:MAG: beta-lactamase family protein [Candidatus Eremiobacteraeota bacterium]|nr:beta-lactamase family protein [Candidatus Eremiobacteraeota bacterium]